VLLLNGYLELPLRNMSSLITTSNFGDDAGLVGAIVLAHRAFTQQQQQQQTEKSIVVEKKPKAKGEFRY
jgi:hypothetical protein